MKRIGLEMVFFTVVLPLFAVFVLLYTCGGLVLALLVGFPTRVFKGEVPQFVWEPWRGINNVATVIHRHLRYLWFQEFLPQKQKFKESMEEVKKAQEQKRIAAIHMATRRRLLNDPLFDTVDVGMAFVLIMDMVYLTAFIGNLIISGLMVLSVWQIQRYYDVAQPNTKPQPEIKVVFEPQVVDKQEADYGPWLRSADVADKKSNRNIALLSDTGMTHYSARFTGLIDNFKPYKSEKIISPSLTESGQIVFKDQHGNKFLLSPYQVFIFEGYKTHVFAFDHTGKVLAVNTKDFVTKE